MDLEYVGLPLLMITPIVLGLAVLAVAAALKARKAGLAIGIVGGALIWLGIYFAGLLAVSLTSRQHVLGLNQEKAFCGAYLDCHLSVAVVNVRQTKTLGEPPTQKIAAGAYYVVTTRISSDAVAAALPFENPNAIVADELGQNYYRSLEAESALEAQQGGVVPFEQTLEHGMSYTKDLVFDLPANVQHPRLLVTEGHWLERLAELFLIGDEDSLFHKPTVIRLEP